jgi:uroporphyrinogen decarboxylase
METMTGRERIMTALRNRQPDRVPATPDISIMIPTKLTGKPSWEVEYNRNPSLQTAYINAAKYFGIDGWLYNGRLIYKQKSEVHQTTTIVHRDEEKWIARTVIGTPDGDMTSLTVYPKDNPSAFLEWPVKDFKADFKKLRHLYSEVVSCDASFYQQQRREVGELGMICCGIWPPGLQNYVTWMDFQALTYAYYDYPDLFEELVALDERMCLQMAEMAIDAGVESILTGGSGSITLQSPQLFRKLSLPIIKKVSKMARQAGIISGIHSCGKERYLVEACANETDIDYINPLEIPLMGDCDLAELKREFGDRIALMGNLHTTDVMLLGSVTDVRRESLKAILAAGQNGGFVLSTGDQCGRDTPVENIFEMVRVAKEFGAYPLDRDRIAEELRRLETSAPVLRPNIAK